MCKEEGLENKMISVIIPVYNVAPYLSRCIDSVLNQSYSCFEVIIVDDASTDGSGEICDYYKYADNRVSVFHVRHGGTSRARNIGLKHAKGAFIGFVDADDYIASDMYEKLLENMEEGIDIVCCGRRCIVPKGKSYNAFCFSRTQKFSNREAMEELLLLRGLSFSVCTKIFRKELFENIRFPVGKTCEDLPTTYKLVKQSRSVIHIGQVKYYNCYRQNSCSAHIDDAGWIDYIVFSREILKDVKKYYPKLIKQAEARYLVNMIITLKWISRSNQDYIELEKRLKVILKRIFLNGVLNPYLPYPFKRILLKYKIFSNVDWEMI